MQKEETMARLAPALTLLRNHFVKNDKEKLVLTDGPQRGVIKFIRYVLTAHPPRNVDFYSVNRLNTVTEGLAKIVTKNWPLRAQIKEVLNPFRSCYDETRNNNNPDLEWKLLCHEISTLLTDAAELFEEVNGKKKRTESTNKNSKSVEKAKPYSHRER